MTDFYDDMAATATQMLTEFGQNVTLQKKAWSTAYDTTKGRPKQVPKSGVDVRKGAVFDYPPGKTNGPGGLIVGGDKRLLLEAGAVSPSLDDRVIIGGVDYVIKGIQEINPAGTVVMYDMQIRT